MTQKRFEEHLRASLANLGVTLDDADAIVEPLPGTVPAALRAWYRIAGRSDLNSAHNRILGHRDLRHEDGRVIFVEENQDVVVWGFDPSTNLDDPPVWQGQVTDQGFEWYPEDLPVCQFLVEMLTRTVFHDICGPRGDPGSHDT